MANCCKGPDRKCFQSVGQMVLLQAELSSAVAVRRQPELTGKERERLCSRDTEFSPTGWGWVRATGRSLRAPDLNDLLVLTYLVFKALRSYPLLYRGTVAQRGHMDGVAQPIP